MIIEVEWINGYDGVTVQVNTLIAIIWSLFTSLSHVNTLIAIIWSLFTSLSHVCAPRPNTSTAPLCTPISHCLAPLYLAM